MNNNWVKFLIKDFLKSKLFWIFIIIISIFALIYSMKEVSYIKEALDFVNNSLKFKMGEVTLTPILILKYIFICSFLFWIAKKLVYIIKIIINNIPNIDNNSGVLLSKLVSILIYFFVFIISLKTIGIDVTAIAMFGSALGIGIGFSLQRVLSNFISGIIILSEKSLSKGDLVELEDGTRGFITDIKIRYTIITD